MTQGAEQPGRLLLRNARLGPRGSIGDVAIDAGRIVERLDPRAAEVIDVAGRVVVPGLYDAHVHFDQWASVRQRVDVAGTESARQAVDRVVAVATGQPEGPQVVRGYGFRDGLWPEAPHKDLFEAALPGVPVVLQSNDLHTAWFSPAALDLIGAADHETGVFLEGACHAALAALPPVAVDELDRWAAAATTAAATRGVTGILDLERPDNLTAWIRRARQHRIDLRVTSGISRSGLDDAISRGLRTGEIVPDTGGLVEVGPVKLFVDGSLNSRTALCHAPYPGLDGEAAYGILETPIDELRADMSKAKRHGLQCAVHAIGDRANTIALDLFEELDCQGSIEHVQMLAESDLPRVSLPGLTLSVQPAHGPDDRDVADRHWSGRTDRAFAFADMLAAGGRLAIGSDAPVSPLDPWDGIASAVTRTDDDRPAWHPEQAIPVAEALAAASRGRCTPRAGDPADLAVLDDDPLEIEPPKLRDLRIGGTLLGGRWTHRTF